MENFKPDTFRENGIMNPYVSISQLRQFQHMLILVSYISPSTFSLYFRFALDYFKANFGPCVYLWKIFGGMAKGPKRDIETVSNGSVKPLLVREGAVVIGAQKEL